MEASERERERCVNDHPTTGLDFQPLSIIEPIISLLNHEQKNQGYDSSNYDFPHSSEEKENEETGKGTEPVRLGRGLGWKKQEKQNSPRQSGVETRDE